MLQIETPKGFAPERNYILAVLLGKFLGLPWHQITTEREDVRIMLEGQPGEVRLPDILFSVTDSEWLTEASMPRLPLAWWDTREFAQNITLVEPTVPVIYGSRSTSEGAEQAGPATPSVGSTFGSEWCLHTGKETSPVQDGGRIALPIDVFGSAFFMLSRYEEAMAPRRDEHERFPAAAAIASKCHFLDRPIIDEYVEILWAAISRIWPMLQRKKSEFKVVVTCDVDSPFAYEQPIKRKLKRLGSAAVRHRSIHKFAKDCATYCRGFFGDFSGDTDRCAISWMMDTNESMGNSVGFFFIPLVTHDDRDNVVGLSKIHMKRLLSEISSRGHEIGIHPGYNTFRSLSNMDRSVSELRRALKELELPHEQLSGRQHYLRWDSLHTPRIWNEAGLSCDSTLTYAERPSFRCGTCRRFPLYDLRNRRPLDLIEQPLIVMEKSVIGKNYMNRPVGEESFSVMEDLKNKCRLMNGDFSILWHNTELGTVGHREMYREIIRP